MRKCKRSLRRGRLLRRKVFDSREETAYFSLLYLQRFSCSFNRLYCYAMLYCTTLSCSIFYCFLLYEYYSVLLLEYIVLFCTIPYNVLYCNTHCYLCCTVYTVLYYIVLYSTMLCCTFLYRAAEAGTGSLNSI